MASDENFGQLLAQLRSEGAIFERLMYKNKSQHRCTVHFQRLVQVRRCLRLFRAAATDELLDDVGRSLHCRKKCRRNESRENVMSKLLGVSRILQEMNSSILKASKKVAGLLEQSYFMPFSITILSTMARLRVLSFQLLQDTSSIYNQLARGFSSLVPYNKLLEELPSSLECKWEGNECQISENKPESRAWFVEDRSKPSTQPEKQQSKATPNIKTPSAVKTPSTVSNTRPASSSATKFLEFIETPRTTTTSVNNKSVAYVSVTGESTASPVNSTPLPGKPQTDSLFDLLLSGKTNESIF